jgi:hypothetical protein
VRNLGTTMWGSAGFSGNGPANGDGGQSPRPFGNELSSGANPRRQQ